VATWEGARAPPHCLWACAGKRPAGGARGRRTGGTGRREPPPPGPRGAKRLCQGPTAIEPLVLRVGWCWWMGKAGQLRHPDHRKCAGGAGSDRSDRPSVAGRGCCSLGLTHRNTGLADVLSGLGRACQGHTVGAGLHFAWFLALWRGGGGAWFEPLTGSGSVWVRCPHWSLSSHEGHLVARTAHMRRPRPAQVEGCPCPPAREWPKGNRARLSDPPRKDAPSPATVASSPRGPPVQGNPAPTPAPVPALVGPTL